MSVVVSTVEDLERTHARRIDECAKMLYEGFRGRSAAWPDVAAARAEVMESLAEGKISHVAVDGDGRVIGWIGAQPQYGGRVWEIHPLIVHPAERRRGIGRALVRDVERLVAARGGLTLWLGSDDETGETSLADVELYDDLPGRLRGFRAGGDHPYPFYERLGFRIVGVMPDANGRGKPDILLAKRVVADVND